MADDKHNGWTNYETWNVKLWIDNDERAYADAVGRARGAWFHADEYRAYPEQSRHDAARNVLADYFEERVSEGLLPGTSSAARGVLGEASLYSDLLRASLRSVDWHEIAEAYLEDCEDES